MSFLDELARLNWAEIFAVSETAVDFDPDPGCSHAYVPEFAEPLAPPAPKGTFADEPEIKYRLVETLWGSWTFTGVSVVDAIEWATVNAPAPLTPDGVSANFPDAPRGPNTNNNYESNHDE